MKLLFGPLMVFHTHNYADNYSPELLTMYGWDSPMARFKQNITSLASDRLRHLLSLHGVSYQWRRDEFPERKFGNDRRNSDPKAARRGSLQRDDFRSGTDAAKMTDDLEEGSLPRSSRTGITRHGLIGLAPGRLRASRRPQGCHCWVVGECEG